MSKIIATDHFKTSNWEVTFEDLAPTYADLFIGFTENAPVIEFKDLKFKYELKQSDNIKQYGVYPPSGVRYVRSDQTCLVVERLKLEMETEYQLYLWAENGGQSFETTVTFTTPRPEQPYNSWTWNTETQTWEAPTPYPDDGETYSWDEENQQWLKYEELL
jgi:hypothetical protein